MGRRLFYLTLVALLGPLLVSFAYEGVLLLVSICTLDATKWFLLGAVLSLSAYVLLLNNNIAFIEHLLHEIEHAALAFFFSFQLPRRMEIDPEQGSEVTVARGGGCLMTLAPYYFPLLTIPFLVLKALAALAFFVLEISFPTVLALALDLLIGATLIFHIMCTVKEFVSDQGDIKKIGFIASLIAVLFLNLMFVILSVVVVTGSYTECLEYIKTAAAATVNAYQTVYEYTKTHVIPALNDLFRSIRDRFCENCSSTPVPW
jgi:hypothetical protein